jgi:hypothetical protein
MLVTFDDVESLCSQCKKGRETGMRWRARSSLTRTLVDVEKAEMAQSQRVPTVHHNPLDRPLRRAEQWTRTPSYRRS